MYAIVEIAGHQYKVEKDQRVIVDKLDAKEGEKVTFDKVLLTEDNGDVKVGTPSLEGVTVKGEVLGHPKGDKVQVFKKKRRKGYKVKHGHRQELCEVRIDEVAGKGSGKSSSKSASSSQSKASGGSKAASGSSKSSSSSSSSKKSTASSSSGSKKGSSSSKKSGSQSKSSSSSKSSSGSGSSKKGSSSGGSKSSGDKGDKKE